MPHVAVPPALPGIQGLLVGYPGSGAVLSTLAQTLLRGDSPLSVPDRELIAAWVSSRNQCAFCTGSHAAAARHTGPEIAARVDAVLANGPEAAGDPRLTALLHVAAEVAAAVAPVSDTAIQAARDAGADDRMIHDTVLIAAAFCMYNRYVDGLATVAPPAPEAYDGMGAMLAQQGYVRG